MRTRKPRKPDVIITDLDLFNMPVTSGRIEHPPEKSRERSKNALDCDIAHDRDASEPVDRMDGH